MTLRSRTLLVSTALGFAPLLWAVPAAAQTGTEVADLPVDAAAAEETTDIVVTGSLIARSNVTAASPLAQFSAEDISDAGTVSISEVLRKDPALGSGSRGPQNSLNGAGSTSVNLRNLGNRRSLVLIDGKRFPIFADAIYNAAQDIGAIPTGMIERVDVLHDGASATYGADAVSGVVNFILREKYDGLQVDAFTGISDKGDGAAYRFSILGGASNDRGSIVVSAQYEKQEEIGQEKRDWARNLVTSLQGAGTINALIGPGGPVYGTTGTAPIACYAVGGGTTNLAPNCQYYDASEQSSLIAGHETLSFGAAAKYELSDDIVFRAKAFYSDRSSTQDISATQINTASATGVYRNIAVAATNTNNPYGRAIYLRWRPTAYGPRTTTGDSATLWATAALSGSLFSDFTWDVSHTYGQTKATVISTNVPLSTSLFNLLNPTSCAADPVCAPIGAIPNIASLLQGVTPLTAAQQNYLFYSPITQSKFTSQQSRATIQGPLFTLPGGEVRLAVGIEHRNETGKASSDEITQSQVPIGSYIFPTDGSFSTNEVFGELDIPLFKDAPFAAELSVNLQARYSDFSTFGGADTYKAGLVYAPIEDVRFRGSYGTSFRAPDVLELFGGGFGGNGSATDPCNSATGSIRNTNATVAANCAALGVPASFAQAATTLPIRSGGNPLLKPERGETYTFGVVLAPRFVPGLSVTVDYYNIKIRDAVTSVTGLLQQTLNSCYSASDFLTRATNSLDSCFSFNDRSTSGDLIRLAAGPVNLDVLSTSGIDFAAQYNTRLDPLVPGALALNLRVSYLDSYKQAGIEYVGTYLSGIDGATSNARWRGSAQVGYSADQFSIEWTANYVDSMRDFSYGTTSVPTTNFLNYSGVPSYWSHDLLLKVTDIAGTDFALGVNNVFDKTPPYAFVSTRNTLGTTYDQIGRYLFVTARHKF
jgi:outer membrane receptor protein involved in Fe transport